MKNHTDTERIFYGSFTKSEPKKELIMKKSFKLEELDCANCAAKMEAAIAKLPGVKKVAINFMAQKMILEAEDDQFDEVLALAQKKMKEVEPDCEIVM